VHWGVIYARYKSKITAADDYIDEEHVAEPEDESEHEEEEEIFYDSTTQQRFDLEEAIMYERKREHNTPASAKEDLRERWRYMRFKIEKALMDSKVMKNHSVTAQGNGFSLQSFNEAKKRVEERLERRAKERSNLCVMHCELRLRQLRNTAAMQSHYNQFFYNTGPVALAL